VQITLVKHKTDQPPTLEDFGEQLWCGGYSDDELPGSILTAFWPDLDVGNWYSFDEFKEKVLESEEENTWTEVRVRAISLHDRPTTMIQVKQDRVVRFLLESVLDLCEQLAPSETRRLWLRVE
jgi:hypothetical protein